MANQTIETKDLEGKKEGGKKKRKEKKNRWLKLTAISTRRHKFDRIKRERERESRVD